MPTNLKLFKKYIFLKLFFNYFNVKIYMFGYIFLKVTKHIFKSDFNYNKHMFGSDFDD